MEEAGTIIFWCDACCGENWEQVSAWMWYGFAVSRSGVLKVAARCHECDEELPVGTRAEATALLMDEPEAVRALGVFIVTEDELKEGTIKEEGV